MSAATWILLTVAAAFLGAELLAWCPPLHRLLIRRAAAALPEAHRDRYLEEWHAELEELPAGPLTRLWFAASLVLRRGGLAGELELSATVYVTADQLIAHVNELLAEAARGDQRAWAHLVDRYAGRVWAVTRGHRLDDVDANEVFQTTWLLLSQHINRLEGEHLGGWVMTVARHEALRILRRRRDDPGPKRLP